MRERDSNHGEFLGNNRFGASMNYTPKTIALKV